MGKTAKLTITLPEELISFTDEIARKQKLSRSKVISQCLQKMAENHCISEMTEGYQVMAKENRHLADVASEIEHEVLPEWR